MKRSFAGLVVFALLFAACTGEKSSPTLEQKDVRPGGTGGGSDLVLPPSDAPADRDLGPITDGESPDALAGDAADVVEDPRVGIPCLGHGDCGGGFCVEGPDGSVCTVECVDSCPTGWLCRGMTLFGGSDQVSVCVPEEAKVCSDCAGIADCGGIPQCALPPDATSPEAGGTCLLSCDGVGSPCPNGFVCTTRPVFPLLQPAWVCAPESKAGCCATANQGTVVACTSENEHGACAGTRECLGAVGWDVCRGPLPAAEVCDNADNDCDGETDEDLHEGCHCGDGTCDPGAGEEPMTCALDCTVCGDGECSPGEDPEECPEDCCGACGDGRCVGFACGEEPRSCPADCGTGCGDETCAKGESPVSCPSDCKRFVCGNGVCEPTDGGPEGCPEDCGASCGNCVCEGGEGFADCPVDCGYCGDGVCSYCGHIDEAGQCPDDCEAGQPEPEICNGIDDDNDGETDEGASDPGGGCDDEDPCTEDVCAGAEGCRNQIAALPCDDGDPCTEGDTCDDSGACAGTPVLCDDEQECTTDSCDPAVGCVHEPADGLSCDDGDSCTENDLCVDGVCAGTSTCDDGDPCTNDLCEAGGGCTNEPFDGPCDDGSACTEGDTCTDGECQGTPIECDDDDPCTDDECDREDGCQHTPRTGPCDDGDSCTEDDACVDGACAGAPADCDDQNPCTVDSCDAEQGCTYADDDGKPCDDGDSCTEGDVCTAGQCRGTAPDCDDNNPCTDDTCDAAGACLHVPNELGCDDGDLCTENDRCQDAECGGDPVACDDGNPCSDDICDPQIGCTYPHVEEACDDGSECTEDDACVDGACVGTPIVCDDDNVCTDDACDDQTGCTFTPNAAPCGTNRMCIEGVCTLLCADECTDGEAECIDSAVRTCADHDEDGCTEWDTPMACGTNERCVEGSCLYLVQPGEVVINEVLYNSTGSPDKDSFVELVGPPGADLSLLRLVGVNGSGGRDYKSIPLDGAIGEDGFFVIAHPDASATIAEQADQSIKSVDYQNGPDSIQLRRDTVVIDAVGYGDFDSNDAFGGEGQAAPKAGVNQSIGRDGDATDTDDNAADFSVYDTPTPGTRNGGPQECDVCKEDADCDDDDACTLDRCNGVACACEISPRSCDDGNDCTIDTCDPTDGSCRYALDAGNPDCGDCIDDADCEEAFGACVEAVCDQETNTCVQGNPVSCDDGNACTSDACDADEGCLHVPQDGECDDGDACTEDDACVEGGCVGSQADCDDGNPCTDDSCDSADGCQSVKHDRGCDDGDACTENDHCVDGTCFGTDLDCEDLNPCTTDWCAPEKGCKHDHNSEDCDDGDACTENDRCSAGDCGGDANDCDDKNGCPDDSCDPGVGCEHLPAQADCDDGDPCTTEDSCSEGVCGGTALPICGALCTLSGSAGDQKDCTVRLARDAQSSPPATSLHLRLRYPAGKVTLLTLLDLECVSDNCRERRITEDDATLQRGGHAALLDPADPADWEGVVGVELQHRTDPERVLSSAWVAESGGIVGGDPLLFVARFGLEQDVEDLPVGVEVVSATGGDDQPLASTAVPTLVLTGGSSCAGTFCFDGKPCTVDRCEAGVCVFEVRAGECNDASVFG